MGINGFTMDAGTLRLTIAALEGVAVRAAAVRALGEAATVLHAEVRERVSLDDHSLTDLADLDHPYARRHGAINTSALGHTPEWEVHTKPANARGRSQTGDLLRATKVALLPSARGSTGEAWTVYFDLDLAPHARYVVQGTPNMLPRDVLWWTATDPAVQKAMMRAVVRVLGKELRSKAILRLTPSGGNPKTPPSSPAQAPGNLAV